MRWGLFRYKNYLEGILQFTLQVSNISKNDNKTRISKLSIPFKVKENFTSNCFFFFNWGPEEFDLGTAWGRRGCTVLCGQIKIPDIKWHRNAMTHVLWKACKYLKDCQRLRTKPQNLSIPEHHCTLFLFIVALTRRKKGRPRCSRSTLSVKKILFWYLAKTNAETLAKYLTYQPLNDVGRKYF